MRQNKLQIYTEIKADSVSCYRKIGETTLTIFYSPEQFNFVDKLCRNLNRLRFEPYLHTLRILLTQTGASHSHPILTLHLSHLDFELFPAVFIHEQMHWCFAACQEKAKKALKALQECFGKQFDLVHLAVCRLEILALSELIGFSETKRLLAQAARYQAEYSSAFLQGEQIDECLFNIHPKVCAKPAK